MQVPNKTQSIQQDSNKLNEAFKKYYSERQSNAMKKALQLKRGKGYFLGNPPLGYIKSNNKAIIPHPDNQYLINEIFDMYAGGEYTLSGIADELNCAGIKTRLDRMFTHNSIYGILKNKAYIGFISSPRKSFPDIRGKHKPIISEELFFRVQKMLKKHKKTT